VSDEGVRAVLLLSRWAKLFKKSEARRNPLSNITTTSKGGKGAGMLLRTWKFGNGRRGRKESGTRRSRTAFQGGSMLYYL